MSRETDTPSSGPDGRGATAYPSGTPPYGTPLASDAGSDAGRSGAQPEERKTETTLTTRIRINIPGSRPIPPVVMRTPVADGSPAEETGEHPAPAPAPVEPPAEPAPPAGEKTSDWFAPRKAGAPKGGPASGATNGAGVPGPSAPRPANPGRVVGTMSAPATTRPTAPVTPGSTHGAGLPGGATGGPVAPGHGGGTGSFDVTEALAAAPNGPRPKGTGTDRPANSPQPNGATGTPGSSTSPYDYTDPSTGPLGNETTGNTPIGNGVAGGPGSGISPYDYTDPSTGPLGNETTGNTPIGNGVAGGPGSGVSPYDYTDPSTGPLGNETTGNTPIGNGVAGGPGSGTGSYDFSDPAAGPGNPAAGEPRRAELPYFSDADRPEGYTGPPGGFGTPGANGPSGPTGGPVTGSSPLAAPPGGPAGAPGAGGTRGATRKGRGPGGGLSDDTAILTPQKPAPEPGTPGYGTRQDHVSGHTVTSGIPIVPPGPNAPFAPGAGTDGPLPHTPPKLPEPVSAPAASAPKAKKKGRSKLVLLGVGVFVIAGGVYGAGLLMNHTDVPKGTTVLGLDIGGGTRDDAVKKLDAAFGERVDKPLKLAVEGKTVSLTPDQAGLQFDLQATVASAAQSDYNPVSVIGSLFGKGRAVTPVMPIDEEKLTAALQSAAGGSGSMTEGTIRFTSGKAVAVYGKAGKGIDAEKSRQAVEDAYRAQVETGTTGSVTVATTTREPTVSKAEVDREMKAFATPAMSANIVVQTDAAHSVAFSPQNSLWKFLKVKAVNGKLVDSPDLDALKELYGKAFDGVLITRGTGQKTAVTPQDVYAAARQALLSTGNRNAVIETDPS
ncbi:hypothetical protein ACIO13_13360 [Streptomyces sp. NPDC087425]|uniref:hypothetical protein n=1 Tax=Streptomyces sp. NPDC087425 TaxID=3365787 RepID=UPI00381AA292